MAEDQAHAGTPQTWLAMLLTHHVAALALATALGAAVQPLWNEVKAWRLGVASSRLQIVEEQRRLWEANLPCLTEQGTYEIDGPDGIIIKVTLCPKTADLLIRYHLGDWQPLYKWVGRPRLRRDH